MEWQIGTLMGVNTTVIVLFEMLLVHAIERWDLLKTIAVGSYLMCTGFSVLLFGRGYWIGFASVLVWTMGEMLAMPQAMAFAGQRTKGPSRSRFLALYSMTVSASFVTGSLLGSACYKVHHQLIWYVGVVAGLIVLGGFWTLSRVERRTAVSDSPMTLAEFNGNETLANERADSQEVSSATH